MELEFELNDYYDLEAREFGATLIVEVNKTSEELNAHNTAGYLQSYSEQSFEIVGATLFTSNQDGGNSRELEVEALTYITENEIMGKLYND